MPCWNPGQRRRPHAQERMRGMHDLIELLMTWFDDVQRWTQQTPPCS
jgi:DNA-binding transcriptional regulator GbsR (MarR family)